MSRRRRGVAAVLVAVFLMATCAVLFVSADVVQADACGRTHVWAPARLAPEVAPAVLGGPALPAGFIEAPRLDETLWLVSWQPDESCTQPLPAEPSAPRAPPLA